MEGFYLRTMRYYRPDYSWLMFLVWEITFPLFFLERPGFGVGDENHLKSLLFFTSPLQWVVLVLVVVFCEKDFCFPRLLSPTELLDTSWGLFLGPGIYVNSIRFFQGKLLFHSKI